MATVLCSSALAAPPAPTHVSTPVGPGGPTQAVIPTAGPGRMVICDQMGMVALGTYTDGNGNAIAGLGAFGLTYDLQTADDCVHGSVLEITQVCQASITFAGLPPADGLWVQVYADAGGQPAATASFDEVSTSLTVTPFVDTVLGGQGEVICADLSPGFVVPAGTWWWDLQPVSLAANADWYYQLRRTGALPTGGDTFGRDGAGEHGSAFGGPHPGGYGTFDWTSMNALGYSAGDSAFSVTGQPVVVDADLVVSKNDGLTTAAPGDPVTYSIVATNQGPADAPGTVVSDVFDSALIGVTWTCSATAGSSCTAAGAGDINDVADILAGGAVTYLASATIDDLFTGALDNTATATAGPTVKDPDPANDSGTDATLVLGMPVAAVPTLGEMGLVLLVVMLAFAALVTLRLRAL